MKKSTVIIAIIASLVLVSLIFATSSIIRGRAEVISDDFQMDKNTLVKYLGSEESVVLPKSCTKVASAAFEGNDSVKRVVLPDNLEEIEYNAFAEMSSLERIVIPDKVKRIGASAFANCENLNFVYIGTETSEIGSSIFAGCEKLASVDVSENNKHLTCVDGVLFSADRSVVYEMLPGREKNFFVFPDTVSAISPYAFWGCNNLEFVNVSDKVEVIPPYAFSGAINLKSVTLSFNTKQIAQKAFENCSSLEQIYIPDSVEKINDSAFDGCPKLNILTSQLSFAEKFAKEKELSTIYEPKYDLSKANQLRENYAKEVAEKAKKEREEAEKEEFFDISKDDSLGAAIVVNGQAVVLMDPTKMKLETPGNDNSATDFNKILSDNLENNAIPDNLFYLKSDIQEITIPENTKYIGKFAFARSGLKKVVIPKYVQSIGFGAIYHCEDLEDVVIPDTVETIEPQAFEKTAWLEKWYRESEDDYLIVGDGILIAYKGKKEDYVRPENVKSVSCDIE
ncbi:MAG: leucine-rich repeat domain-containing protein [Lachnospiraceae bacterium]|nr:leucine-rich repeat domain-containing protein [Lachnospiraceae bacterium]